MSGTSYGSPSERKVDAQVFSDGAMGGFAAASIRSRCLRLGLQPECRGQNGEMPASTDEPAASNTGCEI